MTKFRNNTHTPLSLYLSLYLLIRRCTLIFSRGCACTSPPLPLYLHLQKRFGFRSDPNGFQERMFRQFKICAYDRKYTVSYKSRCAQQCISISVNIGRSHVQIKRGGQAVRIPIPPEKSLKYRISGLAILDRIP